VVALERMRADIRLVVAGALSPLAQQLVDLRAGRLDLSRQPPRVFDERGADLLYLSRGPWSLAGSYGENAGAASPGTCRSS
jgi:hypothetical protein